VGTDSVLYRGGGSGTGVEVDELDACWAGRSRGLLSVLPGYGFD
jgi:hypothetical protein